MYVCTHTGSQFSLVLIPIRIQADKWFGKRRECYTRLNLSGTVCLPLWIKRSLLPEAVVMMVLIDPAWVLMWSEARLVCQVLIHHRLFHPLSSYALLSMEWNPPYGTFQRNICSGILSLEYFRPDKPYYLTGCDSARFIAMERSEGGKCSSLTPHTLSWEMKKNHSATGLLFSDFCFIA